MVLIKRLNGIEIYHLIIFKKYLFHNYKMESGLLIFIGLLVVGGLVFLIYQSYQQPQPMTTIVSYPATVDYGYSPWLYNNYPNWGLGRGGWRGGRGRGRR